MIWLSKTDFFLIHIFVYFFEYSNLTSLDTKSKALYDFYTE